MTDRLDSADALSRQLAALLALDPRLAPVVERAGSFEIRKAEPGFAGLAKIVCGQQLSTASANAIWSRFAALEGALMPASYLTLSEESVRKTGFSAGKHRTLLGVAEALVDGDLDLDHIAGLPAGDAVKTLTRLKGIGPWTAEIYLMFSAAHPDVFPAGDLALQKAVQWAFRLDEKPPIKDLIRIAEAWSPHRAAAALLFWRYYRAVRQKEGIIL